MLPIIAFKKVSYKIETNLILKDVSFSISPGEYVGIVGPNGSGKTTLIRLLVGLLKPNNGAIEINTNRIAYIPQRIVQHEFSFPAIVSELVPETAILKTLHLEKYADRRIGELSGGERQRIFIARALSLQPELMILDEPAVGVDAFAQKQFYALLSQINKEKRCTILMVSHDLEVVAKETQKVLSVNNGQVQWVNSYKIFKHP